MNVDHLSDVEVQIFVFDPDSCEAYISAHIAKCAECRAKAAQYIHIASSLKSINRPGFEFNLVEVVAQQLTAEKKQKRRPDPVVVAVYVLLVSSLFIIVWLLMKLVLTIRLRSFMETGLVATCMLLCFAFLFTDQVRNYNRRNKRIAH